MEPCGFVRSLRYVGPIQPRDGKRLRKRTDRRTAARTDRTAPPGTIGRWGSFEDLVRQSADGSPVSIADPTRSASSCSSSSRRRARRDRVRSIDASPSAIEPRRRRAVRRARLGRTASERRRRPRSTRTRSSTRSRPRSWRSAASSRRRRSAARSSTRPGSARCSTEQFDEDSPPAYVAANERMYKALGLLPAGRRPQADAARHAQRRRGRLLPRRREEDVRRLAHAARSSAEDKITYAHEYTHALQDQHYTVFKDQKKVLDRSDWLMARQAVYEGDATLVDVLLGSRQPDARGARRASCRRRLDAGAAGRPGRDAGDPARDAALPVHDGCLLSSRPPRRPAAGPPSTPSTTRMPDSTEQILHPEKLRGQARRRSTVDRARRTWPRTSGPAGAWRSRTRSASSRWASGSREGGVGAAARQGGGGRLGRRPAGRHRRTGRGLGARDAARPGTRPPTRPSSRPRRRTALAQGRRAGPGPPGCGRHGPLGRRRPTTPRRSAPSPAPWASPARPACRGAGPGRRYIDCGRRDPEQPERVRERDLGGAREGQPRRRPRRLGRVDDARVAIEGVERRRELRRVGRDALGLLGRDRVLDDLGEPGDRPGQGGLRGRRPGRRPRPRPGARPASAALRRIEAIRAWAYWT